MKHLSIAVVVALGCAVLALPAAHAAPKKKSAKTEAKAPVSAEISKSMGDLSWGMTRDELQKKLIDKVKEEYRPLVAKARDAVEEDHLRQAAAEEMKRIRSSYVEFTGSSTGWDVSFLRGEFTHGNDESMLVMRDKNSQNFYFFMNGRLWKWYKAFDAEVFPAGDFKTFASAVTRRFGSAKDVQGELSPGAGERHWLEWQDDISRLRAVDQTDFYGFYCLVFEEKATVGNLARLRTNTSEATGNKRHALVDAVTAQGTADPDDSPDIVDRITGKIRSRPQPVSASSADSGAKGKSRGKPDPASADPVGVRSDDDPLSGLGL